MARLVLAISLLRISIPSLAINSDVSTFSYRIKNEGTIVISQTLEWSLNKGL